ncbi:MAG: hypothetical protein Q9169_003681 [Polycauliona sp. 2 TL-2023]
MSFVDFEPNYGTPCVCQDPPPDEATRDFWCGSLLRGFKARLNAGWDVVVHKSTVHLASTSLLDEVSPLDPIRTSYPTTNQGRKDELAPLRKRCQRQEALQIMRMVNEAYGRPNPAPWYRSAFDSMKNGAAKSLKSLHLQKPVTARQPTLEAQKGAPSSDNPSWTMTHGFYVAMGGLAFTIPPDLPESEQFVPKKACGTWFITQAGLKSLLKIGLDHMATLSEEGIKSKSKANGLAKALVCTQAMWFLTTCITRLAQRIPISLLELNTFGHAVCALFIYLLWWEKPFEVDNPTMTHSGVLMNLYALAWVNTYGTKPDQSPLIRSIQGTYRELLQANELFQALDEWKKREFSDNYLKCESRLFMYESETQVPHSLQLFGTLDLRFGRFPAHQPEANELLTSTGSTTCKPGEIIPGTNLRLRDTLDMTMSWFSCGEFCPAVPSLVLTRQDINRWKMAMRGAEDLHIHTADQVYPFCGNVFQQRCADMPDWGDVLEEFPLTLGFGAAAIIYGGLHALAWNAHFRSSTEQLLWRISSVAVMAGIPILATISKSINNIEDPYVSWLAGVFLLPTALAYVLARSYLVVECFIQLSHLPAGVYQQPEWSTYFPHIATGRSNIDEGGERRALAPSTMSCDWIGASASLDNQSGLLTSLTVHERHYHPSNTRKSHKEDREYEFHILDDLELHFMQRLRGSALASYIASTVSPAKVECVRSQDKMLSPLYIPLKYWMYPLGDTPAVNLLRDSPSSDGKEDTLQVLCLACGDPRSIFFTLRSESGQGTCYRHISHSIQNDDINSSVVILSRPSWFHSIWNLFYNMIIPLSGLVTLQQHIAKLLLASESLQTWLASSYGDYVQFTDEATLTEVRQYWTHYGSTDTSRNSKIDVSFREGMSKHSREIGTSNIVHGLRSAGPLWTSGLEVLGHIYRRYWETGVAGGNTADSKKLGRKHQVNPMFAVSSAPLGEFAVHCGSEPLQGFHLVETLRKLYCRGEKFTLAAQSDRLVEAAKTQFTEWCRAFVAHVQSRRVCVRLFSGEAIALCHQLQLGIGEASVYAKPWKLRPLHLDNHTSQDKSHWPLVNQFDVIDTSNLSDHVGLLNMIVATAPLLKTQATSVLCTESLLAASDEPTSSLSAVLGTDIVTFSLFMGLAPIGLLAGATFEAVINEAGMQLVMSPMEKEKQSQYRQRIRWKSPCEQPGACTATRGNVNVDVDGLAAWLFSVYTRMFAEEDLITPFLELQGMQNPGSSTDIQRYTRAAMVALIRVIKTTVLTNWDLAITKFLDLVNSDRTLFIGSNSVQELNMHFALFGVWTLPVLAQGPRQIQEKLHLQLRPQSNVEGVLGGPDPPSIVHIILSVPRKCLTVFTTGTGRVNSTPGIHVSVKQQLGQQQYDNCFHTIHCYFGRAAQGEGEGSLDQFEEDSMGWLGSADLVVVCAVPTFGLLTGPRSGLKVSLALNLNADNVALYTSKLGPRLTVYETSMEDPRRVWICRNPPYMSTDRSIASHQDWLRIRSISVDRETTATAILGNNHKVHKLLIRTAFAQGSEEAKALAGGVSVAVVALSSSTWILKLGDNLSRHLVFPFPVQSANPKTRIARDSLWIEVEAPIYISSQPDTFDVWTKMHTTADNSVSLGSIPRVNLDVQPVVLSPTKKDETWIQMLMGGMLSETEKYLKQNNKGLSTHPKIDLKECLNIIVQGLAGFDPAAKGRPSQSFQLTPSRNEICHTLIFASSLRHDLDLGSVVAEAWVLPLTDERVEKLGSPGLLSLLSADPPAIALLMSDRASIMWKRLLPALAERCRSWNHKASCEYQTKGEIPLSVEEDQNPLCSCGEGKVNASFTKVKKWAPFAKYVTRIAIGPVFPVPYMDSLLRLPNLDGLNATGTAGSTAMKPQGPRCDNCKASSSQLLLCGGCGKVRYCSKECQKAAWKAHKVQCKT